MVVKISFFAFLLHHANVSCAKKKSFALELLVGLPSCRIIHLVNLRRFDQNANLSVLLPLRIIELRDFFCQSVFKGRKMKYCTSRILC